MGTYKCISGCHLITHNAETGLASRFICRPTQRVGTRTHILTPAPAHVRLWAGEIRLAGFNSLHPPLWPSTGCGNPTLPIQAAPSVMTTSATTSSLGTAQAILYLAIPPLSIPRVNHGPLMPVTPADFICS